MSDTTNTGNRKPFMAARRAAANNTKIQVDIQVGLGVWYQGDARLSIGTDGCGPCVAVLCKMTDGSIFCGHMDCSIQARGPAEIDTIQRAVGDLLAARGITPGTVDRIWIVSKFSDASANAIRDKMINIFPRQITVDIASGLYWSPDHQDVGIVEDTSTLAGRQDGNRGAFGI